MDFSLNDVQTILTDSIEKFVANNYDFETRRKSVQSDRGYSPDIWRQFAELGWTAVPFSEADGGFDGGPIELMIVMEQLGRGLVVEPYLANVVLAGGILKRAANADQKAEWLQPLISGELQATLAFVEPQAGYDIANTATTAVKDSDHWILNGAKSVVLNGSNADLIIVPARTAGKQTDEHGITLFAIASDASGMTIEAYETIDGQRAAEIELTDVRTPQVVGEVDDGFRPLGDTIDEATLAVCAEALGIMSVLTEKTLEYTKSRTQFGVPISSFQSLQHRMVDMYTNCEQTRSLLMWAAMTAADGGDIANTASAVSAIKYQTGTAGRLVAEEAVQLHGGMGLTWELDVAHYFKRLIAITQIFGSADWHLDRLAAR